MSANDELASVMEMLRLRNGHTPKPTQTSPCWLPRYGTRRKSRLPLLMHTWRLFRGFDACPVAAGGPYLIEATCRAQKCCNPWHASPLHPNSRRLVAEANDLVARVATLEHELLHSHKLSHNATRRIDRELHDEQKLLDRLLRRIFWRTKRSANHKWWVPASATGELLRGFQ